MLGPLRCESAPPGFLQPSLNNSCNIPGDTHNVCSLDFVDSYNIHNDTLPSIFNSSSSLLFKCLSVSQVENNHYFSCNLCSIYDSIGRQDVLCTIKLLLGTAHVQNDEPWFFLHIPEAEILPHCFDISIAEQSHSPTIICDNLTCYSQLWPNTSVLPLTLTPEYDWSFLCAIIFIVAGALGNALVCLAVALDKRLQNVTNYFLLSLAVADLLVCLFVMPLGAIPGFLGYWPFGLAWCNIYVTCDVLACSSSILHMCFISLSRYLGVRNPLATRHRATKRAALIKICIAWCLAALVSSSITALGAADSRNIMPAPYECVINNRAFFVLGSIVAFYAPMVVMVAAYGLTVRLLRKKARFAAEHPQAELFRRLGGGYSTKRQLHDATSQRTLWRTNGSERARIACSLSDFGINRNDQNEARFKDAALGPALLLPLRFLGRRPRRGELSANAVATEQKATKVLGVVFFAFVTLWTPFFVLNIVFAACPHCQVPERVADACLWLGYVSSCVNPLIYTIFNGAFREAFWRLLRCDCRKNEGRRRLYRGTNSDSRI